MKSLPYRKSFIALACCLSLGSSIASAAPDLVVTSVTSPNLDSGIIKVRVKNQGTTTSAACYMAIKVTTAGSSTYKVLSPQLAKLAAGQEIDIETQTGLGGLSQADYEAIADRSNTVAESNEKNNSLKGKFGGKP